jgi:hypothetical protein
MQQGGRMNADTRSAYRRTKRTALAVVAVALVVAVATEPGSAAPNETPFNKGTGSATALGYKVNPTNGNLSFGITFGESIAGHQNTAATGQSRAINLGVIGVTLAGKGCDGGDPTLASEKQPQPVIARSGEDGAAEGKTETEQPGGINKFARATTDPFAEAITTIAPMGDPATLFINGGRTITHSGIVGGNTREALARTELGTVSLGGGQILLQGLTWEAIHRSGAVNETIGTFNIGSVSIGGAVQSLPGDGFQQAAALNDLLKPLGLVITPPLVRVEQGIVFVDALRIGVIPSAQRDTVLGGIVGGAQPVRAAVTDALLKADCGNAAYITVADLVLGSFTGAGALGLELGGVQATTAEFSQFQFGLLPALPALPPVAGLSSGVGATPAASRPSVAAAPAAPPAATAAAAPAAEDTPTKPIAKLAGERGGLMAMVAGGGLILLLATAEADRRKMQHALRVIPLEV